MAGVGVLCYNESKECLSLFRRREINMTIEKNRNGSALTLTISGRLDTNTAPQLETELKSGLEGVEHLVLDFAYLAYLSSAGLRVRE